MLNWRFDTGTAVMVGRNRRGPAIHELTAYALQLFVDARHKAGHDTGYVYDVALAAR